MDKKEKGENRLTMLLMAISLVVLVTTQLLTYRIVSKDSYAKAEEKISAVLDGITLRFNLDGRISEEMARSFLSSWFTFKDSLYSGTTVPPGYIADADLRSFKRDVFASLENFMKTAKGKTFSCEFAVMPGIYPETGDHYFIPYAGSQGDNVRDGGQDLNPESITNFLNLLHAESAQWASPNENSPFVDYAVSYCVPLKREDGSRFGMFALNMEIAEMKKIFRSSLPYGEDESAFVVNDRSVGVILRDGSQELIEKALTTLNHLDEGSPSDMYLFKVSLERYPWDLYILCTDDAIYKGARETTIAVSAISVAGLLIIIICLLLITREMKKSLKEKAQVEGALQLAADVQMQMLKSPEASGEGFRLKAWIKPAFETGGDLYDYRIKDGKLIFMIGDVSGKGIAASLFMTRVCSLFRSGTANTDDPCRIVGRMNELLAEGNVAMTFCTLIVGTLDLASGDLELCNAGHTSPVVSRNGEPSFVKLTPSLPIAIEEDYVYMPDRLKLAPGDRILLYTDGINEARSRSHELFGEQRILSSLASEEGLDFSTLLTNVSNFTAGEPQSDDITLLMCEYTNN